MDKWLASLEHFEYQVYHVHSDVHRIFCIHRYLVELHFGVSVKKIRIDFVKIHFEANGRSIHILQKMYFLRPELWLSQQIPEYRQVMLLQSSIRFHVPMRDIDNLHYHTLAVHNLSN